MERSEKQQQNKTIEQIENEKKSTEKTTLLQWFLKTSRIGHVTNVIHELFT